MKSFVDLLHDEIRHDVSVHLHSFYINQSELPIKTRETEEAMCLDHKQVSSLGSRLKKAIKLLSLHLDTYIKYSTNPFYLCCTVHQWFLSLSGHKKQQESSGLHAVLTFF